MLNEKKVMENKLFIYTLLSCSAGFFAGIACVLAVLCIVFKSGTGAIFVPIAGFTSAGIAFAADRVYQQIRKFIKRPYVGDLEDENEKTDLDTTSG